MDKELATKHIDNIMDWFDFARVAKCMELLDWRWASTNGVPNEAEIRGFARELLTHIVSSREVSVACGGFRASKHSDEGVTWLELEFMLDSWDTTNLLEEQTDAA